MIASESQIVSAMAHWERIHVAANGPLNGLGLPKECSILADLLGTMWLHKETEADIPDGSEIARLIKDSN